MEILKLLLSFFIKEKNLQPFEPILKLLSANSFDLKKTLSGLNLDAIAPLIRAFMERAENNEQNKTPTETSVEVSVNLNPIANLADKEIVYALNKYFA